MALQHKQIAQQRMLMAPNIAMALEILRMPTLELRAYLEQQAEENPLLELDEPELPPEGEATSPTESDPDTAGQIELPDGWQTADEQETPEETGRSREPKLDQRMMTMESLHESLRRQLGCQRLSAEEQRVGEAVIQRVNDTGYLEGSVEELAAELAAEPQAVEAAIRLLQRMDPPGVGARDLRECLLLQLAHSQRLGSLAYLIARDHFPLFVANRLRAMVRATHASTDQVERACAELRRLNPKPGQAFACELSPVVIPDLVLRHRDTHYDVDLNDQELPRVNISRTYHRMLRDPRTPKDAKEFLAGKLRRASWLIKAIDERHATLLSIARCLISMQRDFLAQGVKALKPLTQSQVAGLVGRHPSTISRAIAGKTLDTPYGVLPLETFFASSVPQRNGEATISDATIKAEIERMVAAEDPRRPLSDAAIMGGLRQRDIAVARRTIAKYRAALKILPAHLRRRRAY